MPSKMAGNKDSASPPPDASGSTTRLQRNLAEKQRRDKLNGYISELATIVPMVSMASKRLDKTSILRLSAAHLRISQSFLGSNRKRMKSSFKWRPSCFSTDQIREILESVEGFLLVTTANGKIMYVSQSVEKFLGHQNIEMIGHSIFTFVHPSDSDMVRDQLQTLSLAAGQKNGSSPSARCSFYCRLRERNQPRSEVLTYQFVHVVGHMTSGTEEEEEAEDSMEDDGKSSRALSSSSLSSPILKAFIRVVHSNPYNELSLTDAIENEYVTRHSPDGTIVFADHRLSTITGHLPHEVYGMSAYEYIKQEDTKIALFAHKLMFSNNGGTGMIVYRLRTRNEGFVYLKSTGYLQFGKSSAQVDHFVCVNKQLSDEEGERELKKFRDRFTPHIRDTCSTSLYESIKSIQNNTAASSKLDTKRTNLDVSLLTVRQMDTEAVSPEQVITEDLEYKLPRPPSAQNGNVTVVENVQCSYSKRLTEKISLETDLSGRILANYSPLTESSLSTNSPQSEDTCMPSPVETRLEQVETVYSSHDTSSSSNSSTVPQVLGDLGNQNRLLCSVSVSSFPLTSMPSPLTADSVHHINVFFKNETSASHSPAVISEDISLPSHNLWQGSPGSSVLGCPDELLLHTPPNSSGDEASKNHDSGC